MYCEYKKLDYKIALITFSYIIRLFLTSTSYIHIHSSLQRRRNYTNYFAIFATLYGKFLEKTITPVVTNRMNKNIHLMANLIEHGIYLRKITTPKSYRYASFIFTFFSRQMDHYGSLHLSCMVLHRGSYTY